MNHDFLSHRDARLTGAFDYRTHSAQFRCREGVLSIRPVGPEFGVREEEVVLAELESCLQQVGRRLRSIALDMTEIATPKSHGLKFCFELSRRAKRDHASMSIRVGSTAWIDAFDLLRSLGHSEADAHKLVDAAIAKKAKYKDVDSLIHAIYEQNAK